MQPKRLFQVSQPALRVLVVDDEPSICALLQRALWLRGYVVDSALDALAALDFMEASPAHVALIDIRMPGHDGIWLIEQMQQRYPETKIIIVTGLPDFNPRTLKQHVESYVPKPFDPERVCDLVQRCA